MTDLTSANSEGTAGTEGAAAADKAPCGSRAEKARGTAGTSISVIETIQPAHAPPEQLPEPEIDRPSYTTHDDRFRLGEHAYRPGLYWHGHAKSRDDQPAETVDAWICSPIHAVATTADALGGSHGLQLRFVNPSGQWREWLAPMHLLKGNGDELRGELLDMGVRIDPQGNRHLNRWLMDSYPKQRLIAVSQTGWYVTPEGPAFVMPDFTLGSDAVRFQSEQALLSEFAQCGTLPD